MNRFHKNFHRRLLQTLWSYHVKMTRMRHKTRILFNISWVNLFSGHPVHTPMVGRRQRIKPFPSRSCISSSKRERHPQLHIDWVECPRPLSKIMNDSKRHRFLHAWSDINLSLFCGNLRWSVGNFWGVGIDFRDVTACQFWLKVANNWEIRQKSSFEKAILNYV